MIGQNNKTCCGCVVRDDYMKSFIKAYIADPMRTINVKIFIIVCFTVIGGFGIYGCTQVRGASFPGQ